MQYRHLGVEEREEIQLGLWRKESLRSVVAARLASLPAKTLTLDNGPENRASQELEAETGAKAYFAHPYASYERGANENANGLVRRYFPKGTDFRKISEEEVAAVQCTLNTRPRKRLGYRTRLEIFIASVALGG